MKLNESQISQAISDAIEKLNQNQSGKTYALVYPCGFVPNSYKWPAPAERVKVFRDGSFSVEKYDRKRSHGKGSYITLWN